MELLGKSVLVTLVALLCFISSAFTEEVNHVTQTPSYVPSPSPYHHGHHHPHPPHLHSHPPAPSHHHHPPPPHHHHPHPHSHSPAPSPYHHDHHHPPPPHHHHPHPPAKSRVEPPISPPTKYPVKPPVKPPVSPPAKPTVKPPVYPPSKAPVKPPTEPPVKPPVSPPAKSPLKPPVSPPAKPPVIPPVYPPKYNKTLVAVQGTVYCKSCKYASSDNTLLGAKPVEGAEVKLLCKSKKKIVAKAKTDRNGNFLLLGPKTLMDHGFRACRVYLLKSKDKKYSKVSKLHHGNVGAVLKPVKTPGKSAVVINKLVYGLLTLVRLPSTRFALNEDEDALLLS